MQESLHHASSCLNPWLFHLQKFCLELTCPLCLKLLNRPILLPCNHIFCSRCVPRSTQLRSECHVCNNQYADSDIKPAPYMENMLAIYRGLDATLTANLYHPFFSDAGRGLEKIPVAALADFKQKKEPSEAPLEGNSSNGHSTGPVPPNEKSLHVSPSEDKIISAEINGSVGAAKHQVLQIEEIDTNCMEQLLSGSPPSFGDTEDMDGICSDPGNSNNNIEKYNLKSSLKIKSKRILGEINGLSASGADCQAREVKRQKKLDYGLYEIHEKRDLKSENIAAHNCHDEAKNEERHSSLLSTPTPELLDSCKRVCAFCHSSQLIDGTGPMLHYANGKEVVGDLATLSDVIHVHAKCIEWTPQVYFVGKTIKNLEPELARAAKLKCSSCGQKGAALGCFVKSCRKSYHVPCAYEILECRWDTEDFLMLCPTHTSVKFPREKSKSGKHTNANQNLASPRITSKQLDFWATSPNGIKEWVLCGSALSSEELFLLVKLGDICGARVSKIWRPNVTHVIAATDAVGACCRTLKVLLSILNGKWILTMDWVKACIEAMRPVDEEPFEVRLDNHGCWDGPKTGRLRVLDNGPKLLAGYNFYFSGKYLAPFKDDLLKLVITAGGTIIESKDQLMEQRLDVQTTPSTTLIVYNVEPHQGCKLGAEDHAAEAEDLADKIGCQAIRHTWILESIAACKLRSLPC